MRASLTAVVVVLVATLFVVGCTQSTSSSVAPSAVTAPTSAQAAPGASYDGSGSWHFHATARWQNGVVFNDEGDATFTQDVDGNLHATIDNSQITLTRRGSGRTIAYQMSVFESHTGCNTELSGSARINTATNTLQAELAGIEQNCERAQASMNATKNP